MPSVGQLENNLATLPSLSKCIYLRSPTCFNNFRYGKAQFPTVNETFVFVAVGVNDLERTEANFWIWLIVSASKLSRRNSLRVARYFLLGK